MLVYNGKMNDKKMDCGVKWKILVFLIGHETKTQLFSRMKNKKFKQGNR